MARVKANSLKRTPVRPLRRPIGAYTTASVRVIAIIGASRRRDDRNAASRRVMPCLRLRATFSTTTIASSTTSPTDKTMASMVSKLSENPMSDMAAIAPSNEIGMVSSGTIAVRSDPMSATTTNPTRKIVSPRVMKISFNEVLMYRVTSNAIKNSRSSRRVSLMASTSAYNASATAISLAPGAG